MNDLRWIRESNLIENIDDLEEDARCLEVWNLLPVAPWCHPHDEPVWSTKMVFWIHYGIMKHLRPDIAGKIRRVDVTVGGARCLSWQQVPNMLAAWIQMSDLARQGILPGVIEHEHVLFERIHPFEDGNGRTGRMLMNWQRVLAGFEPLLIKASERQDYYRWFH